MTSYEFTVEKVENSAAESGEFRLVDGYDEIIPCILEVDKAARRLAEGEITEIKATRHKDGTVFVSITGAQDRIFAKVRRADNG